MPLQTVPSRHHAAVTVNFRCNEIDSDWSPVSHRAFHEANARFSSTSTTQLHAHATPDGCCPKREGGFRCPAPTRLTKPTASAAVKFTTHDFMLGPRECFAPAPHVIEVHVWRVLPGAPRCDIARKALRTAVVAFRRRSSRALRSSTVFMSLAARGGLGPSRSEEVSRSRRSARHSRAGRSRACCASSFRVASKRACSVSTSDLSSLQ